MSEIKTNKLTGVTSAGSIDVTSEGGSTTTNLQQGLAKMWCNWDGDDNPPTINDSLNVTNFTDNSTADIDINFTNNFVDADYAFMSQSESTFNSSEDSMVISFYDVNNKFDHDIRCIQASARGGANGECPDNGATAHGDLA